MREAQTSRMLAAADRDADFTWDKYVAGQIAARNDFMARLDTLGERIAAHGDRLDSEAMRIALEQEREA